MLPLRPPAQGMVSARSKKCREWDFGADWVVASPFRAWRFSFVLEVAPTGTAIEHGRRLVPCNQRLAAPTAMPRSRRLPRDTSFLQGGPEPGLRRDGFASALDGGELFPMCG